MKKSHLIIILLISLLSSCSSKKSTDIEPNTDITKEIVGKYKLIDELAVARKETRIWTITKVNNTMVKLEETLTKNANTETPKVTKLKISNVNLRLQQEITMLDLQDSNIDSADFNINGHQNFRIFGYVSKLPDGLRGRLTAEDLDSKEQIPYGGVLEFEKIK